MRVIFLNGSTGSGKSRTAQAISAGLVANQVSHGVLDLDFVRLFWPAPDDDPFNQRLEIENMTLLADSFARRGAQVLVLAGVLESAEDRRAYESALATSMSVHLLTVDPDVAGARLLRRHQDDPDDLRRWHLERHREMARKLLQGSTHDHLVVLGTRTPDEVAAQILTAESLV